MLIGSFTENLMKAHKSRPASFVKSFSERNKATVKEAMKRVHHENCTYVLNALKREREMCPGGRYCFSIGKEKAIKLTNKSKFGWLVVNEYLSDKL